MSGPTDEHILTSVEQSLVCVSNSNNNITIIKLFFSAGEDGKLEDIARTKVRHA